MTNLAQFIISHDSVNILKYFHYAVFMHIFSIISFMYKEFINNKVDFSSLLWEKKKESSFLGVHKPCIKQKRQNKPGRHFSAVQFTLNGLVVDILWQRAHVHTSCYLLSVYFHCPSISLYLLLCFSSEFCISRLIFELACVLKFLKVFFILVWGFYMRLYFLSYSTKVVVHAI